MGGDGAASHERRRTAGARCRAIISSRQESEVGLQDGGGCCAATRSTLSDENITSGSMVEGFFARGARGSAERLRCGLMRDATRGWTGAEGGMKPANRIVLPVVEDRNKSSMLRVICS